MIDVKIPLLLGDDLTFIRPTDPADETKWGFIGNKDGGIIFLEKTLYILNKGRVHEWCEDIDGSGPSVSIKIQENNAWFSFVDNKLRLSFGGYDKLYFSIGRTRGTNMMRAYDIEESKTYEPSELDGHGLYMCCVIEYEECCKEWGGAPNLHVELFDDPNACYLNVLLPVSK